MLIEKFRKGLSSEDPTGICCLRDLYQMRNTAVFRIILEQNWAREHSRGACAVPVAGEARLIADIEALAEETHPLDGPRRLQLPQPAVPHFALVHLQGGG